jgi:hypothetical protein
MQKTVRGWRTRDGVTMELGFTMVHSYFTENTSGKKIYNLQALGGSSQARYIKLAYEVVSS